MKINAITFDNGEMPSSVTVTLTMGEVAWIAGRAGAEVPTSNVSHEIYSALVRTVVHPYWEDGVEELAAQEVVHWAPIQKFTSP